MSLHLTEFEYELPAELIAQHPARERDAARLLVHDLGADSTEHRLVRDLLDYLLPGDLLVINNTRVLPSRLLGKRASGGRVELLLLEPAAELPGAWIAMVNPARKLRPGEYIKLEGGSLGAHMIQRELDGDGQVTPHWILRLQSGSAAEESDDTLELLERFGHIPLPPYIRREAEGPDDAQDKQRYQTVYAREAGAVAAPTAGLHFTPELLQAARGRGVEIAELTLHVGHGTFQPVQALEVSEHRMHAERYRLSEDVQRAVQTTRDRGGRVIAVGTTSVRVLETCAEGAELPGGVLAGQGSTRLFLYPGCVFKVVDAIFTNFHLPHSSLLMLVSAFGGTERVLDLYRQAVEHKYRFFSYGDAMFLHSRKLGNQGLT